jgi:hypothetical protein
MQILITYDVSIRQPEVKKELKTKGFLDYWVDNQISYYLPNTTLWHPNLPATTEGKRIFLEVVAKLNLGQPVEKHIKVERLMVTSFSSWSGEPGNPHAE